MLIKDIPSALLSSELYSANLACAIFWYAVASSVFPFCLAEYDSFHALNLSVSNLVNLTIKSCCCWVKLEDVKVSYLSSEILPL